MKKLMVSCVAAVAVATIAAATTNTQPKELKVLMIGNSFSICVGKEMPKIAKAMGLKLDLASLYIGGCSLERHWQNWVAGTNAAFRPYCFDRRTDGDVGPYQAPSTKHQAPTTNNQQPTTRVNIPEAVGMAKWDVVTFQQASHFSWRPETYQPFSDNLQAAIRKRLPDAEFVWQETWSYTPWDGRFKKWGIDQSEMYAKLHEAYAKTAKGQRIIPMGTAVQMWRKELPVRYAPDSFGGDVVGSAKFEKQADGSFAPKGDVFHLNREGHYLQALVWTAKLFGVDVRKCPYAPDHVSPEKAALMKRVAMEAVENGRHR